MSELACFNTSEYYEAEIKEKAEEIRKLCIQHGIPCFMAFGTIKDPDAVKQMNEEQKNSYDIETVCSQEMFSGSEPSDCDPGLEKQYKIRCVQAIPELLPAYYYDRRFSDFINIVNGFRAVPRSERLSSEIEEEVIALPDQAFRTEMLDLALNLDAEREEE